MNYNSDFSPDYFDSNLNNERLQKDKCDKMDIDEDSLENDRIKPTAKKRGRKRKNVDENDKLYCICRTSKTDELMILCDKCEKWYHCRCVKITESLSKRINKYFCPICLENDPTLEFEYKDTTKKVSTKKVYKEDDDEEFYSNMEASDDDDDDFVNEKKGPKKKIRKPQTKKSTNTTKKRGRKKGQTAKANEAKGKAKGRKKNANAKKTHVQSSRSKRNRRKTVSDDSADEIKPDLPKQCYGPGCIKAARKGSKYCSDQCGTELATARILEILPQHLENKKITVCAADKLSMREIAKIRQEVANATNVLTDLDRKEEELNILIEKGKSFMPYNKEESIIAEGEDCDYTIHCIICSHEVSIRNAIKHMERCYNKVESRTSFGSIHQAKSDCKNVFCDNYNPSQKTYCKRLRVLCPEHSKEPKGSNDEVCGCPLKPEEDPMYKFDKFCRVLKKKCSRHYNWTKYRQAVIDAQRIQQWLKIDEILEQEQKIHKAMSVRHGLLPLLLHKTTPAHDTERILTTSGLEMSPPTPPALNVL